MNAIYPIAETCNGIDDDCNGRADDGPSYECSAGQLWDCGLKTGGCVPGYRICIQCKWSDECFNETRPSDEVCNNSIDDDCDGETDEYECIAPAVLPCPDGEIKGKCVCEGRTYTTGYCYDNKYSTEDKTPKFPFEVLAFIGGIILAITMMGVVVMEVRKFRKIEGRIKSGDQVKAKMEPRKKKLLYWVSDVVHIPDKFLNKETDVAGYVKLSQKVSENEFWYTFYDQLSTMALRSGKQLKEGYVEIKVVVKKTPLNYLYAEVL